MEKMSSAIYQKSTDYKVICLLRAYRMISGAVGPDFHMSFARKGLTYSLDTLVLIEAGIIQLDESDILAYTKYIADIYGFSLQRFYDALYTVADSVVVTGTMPEYHASLVSAINKVTNKLQRENVL